jgi:predicted ATPase/DNA-binding SARP family transcriptional activator
LFGDAMAQIEFRVLGGTVVAIDGEVLTIPAGRQRALLAYLLIHRGEVIPPERLLDAVWGEKAPASGVKNLRNHLSQLRKALGPCSDLVVFRNSGYVLDAPADALDSERFESLLSESEAVVSFDPDRAAILTAQALELWRGSAFADCAYEEFAQAEVRRLEELRLAAVEIHNDAELASGRADALVPDLEAQVAEYPLREGLWAQLMYALYRTGRQPEALRTYTRAKEVFAQLGTVPSADLGHLEELILLRNPSLDEGWPLTPSGAPATSPRVLPAERTPFIGRVEELRLGAELLGEVRLLTVLGPPGAGKTRLACQLAAERNDDYPHGVFFVPLAAVVDAALVEPAIARVLGVRGGRKQSTHESLAAYLRERSLLLILDNLEQIRDGAAAVTSDLLDVARGLTILATSRTALGIHGEQELPLGPLGVPGSGSDPDPTSVMRCDAVALFVSRARAADPRFRITPDNATDVAHIVRRLDGLPLAIELAAARVKMLRPAAMRRRLGQRLDLLTGGPQDVIDHHRTLRSAIAWSYHLLDEDEQRLFRSLGVFRGFTLGAAAAVAQRTDAEVFDGIASLLDNSLVYHSAKQVDSRFALLETIREFAKSELRAAGELEHYAQSHADYFAQLVREFGPLLTTARQNEAMDVLTSELDNIREALRFAADSEQGDLGLEIADNTWHLWEALGQAGEGQQWLNELLATPAISSRSRARGLSALAGLLYWQAEYTQAWAAYEEALQLFRSLADTTNEADTLFGMSMTATWDGDAGRGEKLANEALALLENEGRSDDGGRLLMAKAWAMQRRGRFAEARPMWDEALSCARQREEEYLVITQLIGIAVNEWHAGDRTAALQIALEALDRAYSIHNMQLTIWALDVVASLAAADAPGEAICLAAAVRASRRAIGGGMPVEPLDIASAPAIASGLIGAEETDRATCEGAGLDWEQAYAYARESLRKTADVGQ